MLHFALHCYMELKVLWGSGGRVSEIFNRDICQRANTVAVMCTHPTSVHESCDFKTAKEVIDFALNINRVLRLGDDAGMVHLSPFSLNL
jgi:hypothetical protein